MLLKIEKLNYFTTKQMRKTYSHVPKNSQKLFLLCKKSIITSFNPTDLQKSLAISCRDNGVHKLLLVKEILNAKNVYKALNTKISKMH